MDAKFGYSTSLSIRVEELIREGTFIEILELVRKEIEGEWQATAPHDTATREAIYHELHALSRVDTRIQSILGSIRMAEATDTYGR